MKITKIIAFSFLFALSASVLGQNDSLRISYGENDTVNMAYTQLAKMRIVGAVDVIQGDELLHSTDFRSNVSLAGLASGLYVSKYSGGPGTGWSNLKVRGLSRGNLGDDPLIVVDGIPNRNFADLSAESIESITVLKDVTTKMLYGSQAADGVILITTKRGKIQNRKLLFSFESGLKMPTRLPVYVNAATYAEKYNQARLNDSLGTFYSDQAIAYYRNHDSPLLYPDMDYYGTFLKKSSDFERINSTLTGGNDKTRYYLNIEYMRETGIESVGETNSFNQLNLVSNLDYQVNDIISVSMDISSRMGLYSSPNINETQLFSGLSTQRPNDYPFFITHDQSVNVDSLAYNTVGDYNLYGQLTRSGYLKRQDFSSQATLGLNMDFNHYINGLSAKVLLGFDAYNNIYTGKNLEYATYRIVTADSTVRVGEDEIVSTESVFGDDFYRNIAGYAALNYNREIGKSSITSNIIYSIRQLVYKSTEDWQTGVRQDYKGINLGFRFNYTYDKRYILEFNSSYMGSDKFQRDNRYKPFFAGGAAWMLSNEEFMSGVSAINYLKLKGSYGVMGYDKMMNYYVYQSTFSGGGAYYFGTNNADAIDYAERISKIGNPDFTFEEAEEINIGFEGIALNKLSFEFNYFNELRTGIPTLLQSTLPGYVSGIAPTGNFNEIRNSGIDLSVNFNDQSGDLRYSIGGNLMFSEAKYEVYNEVNLYPHLNRGGKVTDVLFGFQDKGLYVSNQEIINDGVTSAYGVIIPGDIKYVNYINDLGDNVINDYDMMEIGHYFPRFNYALNADFEYKGIGLYLLGQGVADVDRLNNTSYFFNYGERKYSEMVLEKDYPRLTTSTSGGHSYQNSTYWLTDASYFKLRILELSYILPEHISSSIKMSNIRLFIKGTDLFTITKYQKLDPEDINAGVTKYPLFRTTSLGAKFTF